MNIQIPLLKTVTIGSLLIVAQAVAAPANSPLFLASPVKPAIILGVDDSGSMDSELSLSNNDGALWWHTGNQSFSGLGLGDVASPGTLNFNNAGNADATWKKYVYLFPNGTATGARLYADSTNDHYAIPPLPQFAYVRSSTYNPAYFNPSTTYTPWQSYGAVTFANATATAAKSDPVRGTGTMDLTADIASNTGDWKFRMHAGMVIPTGTYYKNENCAVSAQDNAAWVTAASDIAMTTTCNVGIRYFPATYYLPHGVADPSGNTPVATNAGKAPGDAAGACPANCSLDKYEIKSANFTVAADYSAAIQNFANWFTYYRKRHMGMRNGFGKAFYDLTETRIGTFRINSRPASLTMYDISTDLNTVYGAVYGYVNSGGTPLRESLEYAGQQFRRTGAGAPVLEACQKNYTILFTDGFANSGGGARANADGAAGSPYADTLSDTMGDIAMYHYNTNLRTDLTAGLVPTDAYDTNPNLHMVTYGIGLNLKGVVYGVNAAATADPFTNPPTWPTTLPNRHPSAVDDLWHATINGRGVMLNAITPAEIATQLKAVINSISDRQGSASAVATNSTSLDAGSRIYQAKFSAKVWDGQLLSFTINPDSTINTPAEWNAGDATHLGSLVGASSDTRVIITKDAADGVAFQYANLTVAQKAALDANGSGTPDGRGEDRVAYLRGQSQHEGTASGTFRQRSTSKLGDIVNSSPWYVSAPSAGHSDLDHPGYSTFRTANLNRKPVVYVGANDGMLHGFDASFTWTDTNSLVDRDGDGNLLNDHDVSVPTTTSGKEVLGYVPTLVYSNLSRLTDQNYNANHRYFVDGSPMVADACVANCTIASATWKSILVGSMNAGGKGYFALDVSNSTNFTNGNAAGTVLWEFTEINDDYDSNSIPDGDLGMTYNLPALHSATQQAKQIVKMENDKWAVVLGNGYFSTNGKPVLYILYLENGEDGVWSAGDYVKIVADVSANWGSNGLSTPVPFDSDGNGKADVIYAGDLKGNMWKFNVSAASPASWTVAYSNTPLYIARDASSNPQPIVAPPEVTMHPTSGLMVLFGTGKYIEAVDNNITPPIITHSFYGVQDNGSVVAGRTSLNPQTLSMVTISGVQYPNVAAGTPVASPKGWYVDLNISKERVTGIPKLDNGLIFFNTFVPSTVACDVNVSGRLLALDYLTGGLPSFRLFDTDNDGDIDSYDTVVAGFNAGAVIGGSTLISAPSGGGTGAIVSSDASGGLGSKKKADLLVNTGRVNWREILQ